MRRGVTATVGVFAAYVGLFIATFFLHKLVEEVGTLPVQLILVGALLGTLIGHFRQHVVEANTFVATAKLTFRKAMNDNQVFALVLRALEWIALALAGTGVTLALSRLQ